MRRSIARSFTATLLAAFLTCYAVVTKSQTGQQNLDTAVPVDAPAVAKMVVDADGALHFGPRTVPLPGLASPEARSAYTRQMLQRAQASAARGGLASARSTEAYAASVPGWSKEAALKIYPVVEQSQKIAGVGVTIYAPKVISAKNRNRVVLEFEIDAEAIAVASLGQLKVIKVNYRGGGPSIPGNEDIVAVYRELLKTYKPKSGGMRQEAARMLSISQRSIDYLVANKELKVRRIGSRVLIPVDELRRYARADHPKPLAS